MKSTEVVPAPSYKPVKHLGGEKAGPPLDANAVGNAPALEDADEVHQPLHTMLRKVVEAALLENFSAPPERQIPQPDSLRPDLRIVYTESST